MEIIGYSIHVMTLMYVVWKPAVPVWDHTGNTTYLPTYRTKGAYELHPIQQNQDHQNMIGAKDHMLAEI